MSQRDSEPYIVLGRLLLELESALQRTGLWEATKPDAKSLASQQPFCVDTLGFHQWLQFVFIPNFEQMIAQQIPLPHQCQVAPMAEEMLKDASEVIEIVSSIDALLTNGLQ